jgi:hypothetical protein
LRGKRKINHGTRSSKTARAPIAFPEASYTGLTNRLTPLA